MTQDHQLIELCIRGDNKAWTEFVQQFTPPISSTISRVLSIYTPTYSQPDVDDIVQEVFSTLVVDNYRTLRSFRFGSSLRTWLCVIASSKAIDHLRRQHGKHLSLDSEVTKEGNRILESYTDSPSEGLLELLHESLGSLCPRDRWLLRLYYNHNKSYHEIAKIVGLSTNAVGPAIARARRRLQRLIIKRGGALK